MGFDDQASVPQNRTIDDGGAWSCSLLNLPMYALPRLIRVMKLVCLSLFREV